MVYRDSIARCGFFMIPNSSIAWGIVMRNTAKTRKGKSATGIQNSVFGKTVKMHHYDAVMMQL